MKYEKNSFYYHGTDYELSSFKGGSAGNAIPSQAEAVIVTGAEDQEQIGQCLAAYCEELNEQYKGIEGVLARPYMSAEWCVSTMRARM